MHVRFRLPVDPGSFLCLMNGERQGKGVERKHSLDGNLDLGGCVFDLYFMRCGRSDE